MTSLTDFRRTSLQKSSVSNEHQQLKDVKVFLNFILMLIYTEDSQHRGYFKSTTNVCFFYASD